ncbi:hypothetical protein Ahy_A07g033216 [Arachis hypogaea]|uniref:Aminotransferase-like plant mobile domain-containing protein n=1 Tax=Arachis hypogaea TaxID=3818 RepID=A0A445C8J0_ARAHY|nr:hypothetical protein Ahy_A07g033216 [Arachis hypogaea]
MSFLYFSQFVWVAYAVDRVDPNIVPAEIYMQSVVWTATVPLVSFECIEWHATDRYRRQFGFVQGVPHQERNLDKAHGEVLTGPKNLNWATTPSHSGWVMHWTNRYNYVLSELPMPSQHPLETYMYWYRSKYGDRLNLSNLVGQDSDEGNQDMDDGNESMDEDSQDADEDNKELEPQSPPPSTPNLLPQEQPQFSREGCSFSQLLEFMAADAGQSQYGNQPEFLAVDDSNDEDDDDEEDEIEEFDEDEESRNDGQAQTPDDKGKDYNLRIDPPHRSANRYTPSVFKKAAKKCKNFVNDVKWAMRK